LSVSICDASAVTCEERRARRGGVVVSRGSFCSKCPLAVVHSDPSRLLRPPVRVTQRPKLVRDTPRAAVLRRREHRSNCSNQRIRTRSMPCSRPRRRCRARGYLPRHQAVHVRHPDAQRPALARHEPASTDRHASHGTQQQQRQRTCSAYSSSFLLLPRCPFFVMPTLYPRGPSGMARKSYRVGGTTCAGTPSSVDSLTGIARVSCVV